VVVRGCPAVTVQDCCEWHGSGTDAEDDPGIQLRRRHYLDRRVRPILGNHRLVGKPRRGAAVHSPAGFRPDYAVSSGYGP
jgi:hypothetical protein